MALSVLLGGEDAIAGDICSCACSKGAPDVRVAVGPMALSVPLGGKDAIAGDICSCACSKGAPDAE